MTRYNFFSSILNENQHEVFSYINSISPNYHYRNQVARELDLYPHESLKIIKSIRKGSSLDRFFYLLSLEPNAIVTIGGIGSGKTLLNKWIAQHFFLRGYTVFYRNPDFELPRGWHTTKYSEDLPYQSVYEFVLGRKLKKSDSFRKVIREVRSLHARGLSTKRLVIIHDEVSADVDSKVFNSPGMKNLRHFLRELRKLGRHVLIIFTDVLATNISIDFIRQVRIKFFKKISPSSLRWDRENYFVNITNFLPRKFETLAIFESFDEYLFLDTDLSNITFGGGS